MSVRVVDWLRIVSAELRPPFSTSSSTILRLGIVSHVFIVLYFTAWDRFPQVRCPLFLRLGFVSHMSVVLYLSCQAFIVG